MAAGHSRPGGNLQLSSHARRSYQNWLAATSTGKRVVGIAKRLHVHNLIIWAEGDSLKSAMLAKRLLCASPNGLIRHGTTGKRQLNARAMCQADSLAVMAQLLSRSSTLSRGARGRRHRTVTHTTCIGRPQGKSPTKE